jgi:hypothetical protein
MLNNKRCTSRVTCFSKCFLYHNGSKYPGILENISISGALVSVSNSLPYVVQLGDMCSLVYCNDSLRSPGEFHSKVVRLSTFKVGLQFEPAADMRQQVSSYDSLSS